jgi:hypothetical protein
MANQHHELSAGGIRISRIKPAVKFDAISALKINVLKGTAQLGSIAAEFPGRIINVPVLKPPESSVKKGQEHPEPKEPLLDLTQL